MSSSPWISEIEDTALTVLMLFFNMYIWNSSAAYSLLSQGNWKKGLKIANCVVICIACLKEQKESAYIELENWYLKLIHQT